MTKYKDLFDEIRSQVMADIIELMGSRDSIKISIIESTIRMYIKESYPNYSKTRVNGLVKVILNLVLDKDSIECMRIGSSKVYVLSMTESEVIYFEHGSNLIHKCQMFRDDVGEYFLYDNLEKDGPTINVYIY